MSVLIDKNLASGWMVPVVEHITRSIRGDGMLDVEFFCTGLVRILATGAQNAAENEYAALYELQEAICYGLQVGIMSTLTQMDPVEVSRQLEDRAHLTVN